MTENYNSIEGNTMGGRFSKMNKKVVASYTALGAFFLVLMLVFFLVDRIHFNALYMFGSYYRFPLAIIFAGILMALYGCKVLNDNKTNGTSLAYFLFALSGISLIASIIVGNVQSFEATKSYAKSIKVSNTPIPSFKQRVPLEIAQAFAPNGVSTAGDIALSHTKYIPTLGTYTTPVNSRITFGGYKEVVNQKIALDGSVKELDCTFSDKAQRALDGSFSHNLKRLIVGKEFGILIDSGDAYMYCDGDTPKVVVPFKKLHGTFLMTEVPAGVAVYDGKSGSVKIVKDEKGVTQIPGQTYPISLAEKQRDASAASGSFMDYFRNRVGYEPVTDDGSNNNGEFTLLENNGKQSDYVTPLTRRGSGTSIVAVSTINADSYTPGKLNPLNVHTLSTSRDSNSNVAQSIKGNFPELSWASNGFSIFEIVPMSDSKWVATIGYSKKITNRVEVDAQGNTCLYDANGTQLRCVNASGSSTGTNQNNSSQKQSNTSTGSASSNVNIDGKNLSKMSDKELAQLGQSIAQEELRRAK